MPDVFQVLKQDHDEVKAMLARLEDGRKATEAATAEQLGKRQQLVEDVIIAESRHEAVEQQYFWPAVRELGPDGARVAEEGLDQEAEGERVLHALSKLSSDDLRFEDLLTSFTSAARAHIAYEEAHAWPLLRASISADRAAELGDKITQAKKPTQGPIAGVADRLRDAVTGRGRRG